MTQPPRYVVAGPTAWACFARLIGLCWLIRTTGACLHEQIYKSNSGWRCAVCFDRVSAPVPTTGTEREGLPE